MGVPRLELSSTSSTLLFRFHAYGLSRIEAPRQLSHQQFSTNQSQQKHHSSILWNSEHWIFPLMELIDNVLRWQRYAEFDDAQFD